MRESDVCQREELIEISILFLLALDSFKLSTQEYSILNITEGNTAVIPCELPNGNPRPISIFTLNNNRLDIDPNSSILIKYL